MQIVIDIDEATYKHFVTNEYSRIDVIAIHNALNYSTPLPKGHGRIGDLGNLEDELYWLEKVTNESSLVEQAEHRKLMECINIVQNAPTIIEADKE